MAESRSATETRLERLVALNAKRAAEAAAVTVRWLRPECQARGRWRERLPVIPDTLAALGRTRTRAAVGR